MNCRYCNKALSFLQKVAGNQFCSAAHQKAFSQQLDQLAVERLMQSRPATPPPESDPAPAPVEQVLPNAVDGAVRAPAGLEAPAPQELHETAPAKPPETGSPAGDDDDVRIPAFLLKGKQQKTQAAPAPPTPAPPPPKKQDRYSIENLDDVPLPSFLINKGKKGAGKPSFQKPSVTVYSDEIVLPPGVRKAPSTAPRSDEPATPPPFITRQGRGGARAATPIVAPAAPLVTPPPPDNPLPVAETEPAKPDTPAQPVERQPVFDKFVLPSFHQVPDWIPQPAGGCTDAKPFHEAMAGFRSPSPRMPVLWLDVDPYAAPPFVPAAAVKPAVKVPDLSGSMRIDLPARESTGAMQCTDEAFSPVVPIGPDVDLLLNATSHGQGPGIPFAAASASQHPLPHTAGEGLFRSPIVEPLAFSRPQAEPFWEFDPVPVAMDLSSPCRIWSLAASPDSPARTVPDLPKPFAADPIAIPGQVDRLPDLAEPALAGAEECRVDPSMVAGSPEFRPIPLAVRAFSFARAPIPVEVDVLASPNPPSIGSAGAHRIAPESAKRPAKPARTRFAAMAFPRPKVALPETLLALTARLLEAAGLRKTTEPEAPASPQPSFHESSAVPRMQLGPPAIESGASPNALDASGVPACFRNMDPVERRWPFVEQFSLAPIAPANALPVRFGHVDPEFSIRLPELALEPSSVEPSPDVMPQPAKQAAALPHRRRLAIQLTGKDYPASPLLSPLVCDFASAPMAKVIHQ